MDPVIVVDMEGTLSDERHRTKYDTDFHTKDWHLKFVEDPVYQPVKELIDRSPYEYIILSAKPIEYKYLYEDWLETRMNKYPVAIYMRPRGNNDTSPVLKKKITEEFIIPNFQVVLAIDDRADVCRMFANMGIYSLHFRGGKVWSLTKY